MRPRYASPLLAFFLCLLPPLSANSQQPKLDGSAAGKLLVRKVQDDAVYASWTTINCLRFIIEDATPQYFDFAVRERHDGKCPGEPTVAPIVDRFRINRSMGEVLWYEPVSGDYVAYASVKQRGKK